MKMTVLGTSFCLGLLFLAPAGAQFKDALKKAGQDIKNAAKQGNDSTSKDGGASPLQNTPAPAASPSGAPGGKQGYAPEKEILPDLAVDEAVVASQQEQFRARCEKDLWPQKGVNCDCAVEQYPNARLVVLSQVIRDVEMQKEMSCKDLSSPRCRSKLQQYNEYTSAEFQKTYEPEQSTIGFEVSRRPVCRDNSVVALREEQNCLKRANAGMVSLPPGKSTKAYCGCVKEQVEQFNSPSQAMVACRSK